MTDGESTTNAGLLVYATAEQSDLIVAVARAIGRPIRVAGGPGNADAAAITTAADSAGVGPAQRCADLRHVLSTLEDAGEVDRILVASRGPLEAEERAALRAVSLPVISLEPRPARLADFLAESEHEEVVRVPRFAAGPAWRLAADAIADFGRIALLEIAVAGRPEEGSLHARLHDAMDALDRLVARPAGLAAGMDRGPGDVPEHLAALRGAMALEVRGEDGWCASIACTDAAPAWSRRIAATGPAGRFELDESGFIWTDVSGTVIERLTVSDADAGGLAPGPRAIAHALARPAGDPADRSSRERRIRRFALCESARLAARTGERESPARLADVLGGSGDG
jgi:hypothetical protein